MCKLVKIGLVAVFVCVAMFALMGGSRADVVLYEDLNWVTVVGAPDGTNLGTHGLKAKVTEIGTGNLFLYEYLVSFDNSLTLAKVRVSNSLLRPFLTTSPNQPGNDHTANFNNPANPGGGIIEWKNTSPAKPAMQGPQVAKFWFYSIYAYRQGATLTLYGGSSQLSSASTVGMGPEPGSIVGLGMGLCGFAGAFIRRLKHRK